MMKGQYYCFPILLVLGLIWSVVQADDTDIYFRMGAEGSGEPLVMFSIDWRPSLTATVCNNNECDYLIEGGYLTQKPVVAFEMYRAVLKKVLAGLKGVKVGLMINHNEKHSDESACSGPQTGDLKCTNGGYIPFGFHSLQVNDANGAKAAFDAVLSSLPLPQGNESHKYQGAELFFEFFRYMTGGKVYNGHNGWTDFGTDNTANLDVDHSAFSWDTGIEDGNDNYISPLLNTLCTTHTIATINFMFGVSQQDDESISAITAGKAEGGMSGINLQQSALFESVLAWLRDVDLADGTFGTAPDLPGKQNVLSFFLVPSPSTTEHGYAASGGTERAYVLSNNPAVLEETLNDIFRQVLSLSTTFVSASVPVNVFNRAQTLDNVYVALFQPQENATWPGNLKKLRLARDGQGNMILADANLQPATALDGRIKYNALTFWTEPSALPYPDPNIIGHEADQVVAGKDGRFVSRGGAGQKIPGIAGSGSSDPGLTNNGVGARRLFTEPSLGTTLMAVNADTATATALQTALAAAGQTEALCLLKYVRGYAVTNLASCDSPGVRPWLFGDPLHSRPLPINYGGDPSDPDIRILVGSNDGFLRMFRNTVNGAESGKEMWAFMPRSVMPALKTLQANAVGQHPYLVDGTPVVYLYDSNKDGTLDAASGDKVWLFFGLRRGGKAYYALDISDPDNPRFLWKIAQSGDFAELGLSFSTPHEGLLDWGSGIKPVLIFGGGYDTNKDARPGPGTEDGEGNALFVVDAETGTLVWKAVRAGTASDSVFLNTALVDSIPSEVAAVDITGNGLLDRAYVGDTGGVLWRADFPGNDRSQWTFEPVLSVGRHATNVDRRFFHRPDIAFSKDDNGFFDAVVIGSGDRANPLESTIVNEMYLFKDRHISTGSPPETAITRGDLADLTDNCLQDKDKTCTVVPDLAHGWFIELEYPGEKVLAAPATLAGTVFFTTYRPADVSAAHQCIPGEGGGALYAVKLQDATAVFNRDTSTDGDGGGILQKEDRLRTLSSGGIPAEVVPLFNDNNLAMIANDSTTDDSTTDDSQSNTSDNINIITPDMEIDSLSSQLSWKTFWYQEMQ